MCSAEILAIVFFDFQVEERGRGGGYAGRRRVIRAWLLERKEEDLPAGPSRR